MTNQEIFEFVKAALVAQGEKSYVAGVGCLYRGRDGLKCGIGHIIKDEFYSEDLEQHNVCYPSVLAAVSASLVRDMSEATDVDFLDSLQALHDSCDVDQWSRATLNEKTNRVEVIDNGQ